MNLYNELHGLTVPALLRRRAEHNPFKLALSAHSVHGYRDRVTYAQLVIRMEAMASGLWARGLRPGERIALFVSNAAVREAVLTAVGCYRLGAIVAPLNARASDEELQHALQLVEPTFVVTTPDAVARLHRLYPAARPLLLGGDPLADDGWPEPEQAFYRMALPE